MVLHVCITTFIIFLGNQYLEKYLCVNTSLPKWKLIVLCSPPDVTQSYGPAWSDVTPESEALSWEMTYLKLSSSDSEFSDTEGGRARQQKSESVRVRQCALNCYLNIVRVSSCSL